MWAVDIWIVLFDCSFYAIFANDVITYIQKQHLVKIRVLFAAGITFKVIFNYLLADQGIQILKYDLITNYFIIILWW